MTVEILQLDAIIARITPPAPWECPIAPIWLVSSLLKKILPGSLFAAIMKFAASKIVVPSAVNRSLVATTTNPHDAKLRRRYEAPLETPPVPLPQVIIG